MSNFLQPHGLQYASLPRPSLSPGVCSTSRQLSQWWHPIISTSSPSSPPALSLSQPQGLFQWVGSLCPVAKVLKLQLQHQSFKWKFGVDFLQAWLVWSPCCLRDFQESSPTPQFKSISSLALSLLNDPSLTSVHDFWRNHCFDYIDLCQQSDVSAF